MPIVYRDMRRGEREAVTRIPESLVGAADLCRVETMHGALVWIGGPLAVPQVAESAWVALPDLCEGGDWQMAVVAPVSIEALRRPVGPWFAHHVNDAGGRGWLVPAVLKPDGTTAFPVPIKLTGHELVGGVATPVYDRAPSPAQQRLIDIARRALVEIEAGQLAELPIGAAMAWSTALLAATHHVGELVLGMAGLIDDRLISMTLMAAAGHPVPEVD